MTKQELYNKIDTMFPLKSYNCAQTVLLCMADYFGLSTENLEDIAAPMGGGLCMTRVSVCGAISGAIMAIGLKESGNKKRAYLVGEEFLNYIDSKYNTRSCAGILDVNFSEKGSNLLDDPQKLNAICKPLVRDVCDWISNKYSQGE